VTKRHVREAAKAQPSPKNASLRDGRANGLNNAG
jgi:hypothetical protein